MIANPVMGNLPTSEEFETLVVIATHGGADLLAESLPKTQPYPVVVVETGIVTPAVLDEVDKWDNVAYLHTPYAGYDTGAYLWAFWHVRAKNYLFMQDSCSPREKDYVARFANAMPGGMGAGGWSSFTMTCWDSDAQRLSTAWMYGLPQSWPPKGIFGPIFYTNRKTLVHMRDNGLLPMPPVQKEQQQAMERAWAILFHRAGVRVNFLVDEDMPRGYDMEAGRYPALNKTFRLRA